MSDHMNAPTRKLKTLVRLITEKSSNVDFKIGLENIESWTGRFQESESDFEGEGVRFEPGDLLFGKLRPYLAKAWVADRGGAAVGDFFVIRPDDAIDADFLRHTLLTPGVIDEVSSSVYGAKMPRVNWEFMRELEVLAPEREVQQAVIKFLDRETAEIDAFIADQERLIELLTERRAATISHAVTKGLDPTVPMKDSGVGLFGAIPEHWQVGALRRVLAGIDQGVSPQSESTLADEASIGVLKSGCVNRGVFNELEHKRLPDGFEFDDSIRVRVGDLIVNRASGSPQLVGSAARVRDLTYALILSDKTFRLRVFPRANPDYLELFLNSSPYRRQVIGAISGAEGLANNLPMSELRSMLITLPPRDEQERIAKRTTSVLHDLDTAIADSREAATLSRERRAALISAAVTGKIDVRQHPSALSAHSEVA